MSNFNGCFIKLNSRSPKDYSYSHLNTKTKKLFQTRLENLASIQDDNNLQSSIENRILYEFLQTQVDSMKIETGSQAINLLCKSKRICDDLSRCIDLSRNLVEFPAKILLRQFRRIDPQWEFRGFVYRNKFTALSQYFDFCYFPELNEKKQEIEVLIRNFYLQNVSHKLQHDSFVIDFGLIDSEVIIIELNPFIQGTGTSLFSWKNLKDRNILLGIE